MNNKSLLDKVDVIHKDRGSDPHLPFSGTAKARSAEQRGGTLRSSLRGHSGSCHDPASSQDEQMKLLSSPVLELRTRYGVSSFSSSFRIRTAVRSFPLTSLRKAPFSDVPPNSSHRGVIPDRGGGCSVRCRNKPTQTETEKLKHVKVLVLVRNTF